MKEKKQQFYTIRFYVNNIIFVYLMIIRKHMIHA